jgi:hypothetical protein
MNSRRAFVNGTAALTLFGHVASAQDVSPEFRLILLSKPLSLRARNATREAVRLDAAEAPQRELDQRKQEAAAASAAREQSRATNKAAFRP